MFHHSILGSLMTGNEHEVLCKFLKMKPLVFLSFEMVDSFKFIIDCHESLHKMGTVEKHRVLFATF